MSVQGCRACGRRLGARHAATCTLMDVIDPWVIWRLMQRDRAEFSRAFHGAEILPWRTHWLACARQLGGRVVDWHCTAWADAPDPTVVAVIDGQVHELDGAARRQFREQPAAPATAAGAPTDGLEAWERDALQRHANSGGVDAHLHQIDQEGSPAARAAAAEARAAHGVHHHQDREEVAA